uniref:Uncharacterized protein n=1 Tax=Arundo donax TaxID=35708 RepID=A0A0A9B5G6_ARUDO
MELNDGIGSVSLLVLASVSYLLLH